MSATQSEDILLLVVGAAGGDSAGVAGSVLVDIQTNHTLAHIDDNVTVGGSSTGVAVSASDTTSLLALAGTIGIGGTAGVGVGVDVEVINKDTEASIGKDGSITVSGNVTVGAASQETLSSISVGGGFGGTASVNVQAAVPVISITTKAFVADGTSLSNGAVISAGGSVGVTADEGLTLNVIAGNISGGGSAAVGAAVAVPVVTKETDAWIGNFAQVNAVGNGTPLTVPTGSYGVAREDTRFNPATDIGVNGVNVGYTGNLKDGDEVRYDNGGGTSVNPLVDGNLYYVKVIDGQHVKLYADHALSGSPISLSGGSGENQRLVPTNQAGVTKDTSNRFDPHSADVDYGTSTIYLPYAIDFSNNDQVVYSAGGGIPIGGLVDGGEYYAENVGVACTNCLQLWTKKPADGGTKVILTDPGTDAGKSHSLVGAGNTPSGDASALGPRVITKGTDSFRGVAVTANNSDNLGAFGISFGFSGSAAVNLAGVVNVENIHTSAHIGDSAKINCGADLRDQRRKPNGAAIGPGRGREPVLRARGRGVAGDRRRRWRRGSDHRPHREHRHERLHRHRRQGEREERRDGDGERVGVGHRRHGRRRRRHGRGRRDRVGHRPQRPHLRVHRHDDLAGLQVRDRWCDDQRRQQRPRLGERHRAGWCSSRSPSPVASSASASRSGSRCSTRRPRRTSGPAVS